jgi:hypothetical protein
MHPRRILALLFLFAILALRIEPQFLRLPFLDRTPIRAALTRNPDWRSQQFPRFLEGVRARTRNGDVIAVVVPAMKWDDGYSYAYYRASYFLAGRQVLPLVTSDDRPHPENFQAAQYIAAFGTNLPQFHGMVVWAGDGGVLLRR